MSTGIKLAMCQRSMLPPPLGCNSPPLIGLLNLADGGSTLFRNVGKYLPVDKEQYDITEDPSLHRYENFKSRQRVTSINVVMLFALADDSGCLLVSEETALIGEFLNVLFDKMFFTFAITSLYVCFVPHSVSRFRVQWMG
jgi:hypothetical protein